MRDGTAIPPPETRQRPGSVQGRLLLLSVAAILPMLLLFVAVAYVDYQARRTRAGERELGLARSMAATLERELGSAIAGMNALALSPRLQVNDLDGFRELALRYVATAPAGSNIVLLDRSGQHLVNTKYPPGAALPHRDPAVNTDLTDPLFATGSPMISNLTKRGANGTLVASAEVPVLRDGHVIYDLSLVLPASRFEEILSAQRLPRNVIASVFDRNGINVARVPNADLFVGHAASPSLLQALQTQDEGVLTTTSLEGVRLLSAFAHTQPSGWCVAMGVPEADLRAPLLRALRLAAGAGIVGFLISSAIAWLLAQRILQPIRTLTRLATDPSHDSGASLGLEELDAVAAALRRSLLDRQAAMDQLQSLNEGLEARIRQEAASRVRAQEQLAQAQRMEALGQLAGGIAHDFNNVLQAISGGLSLIQRRAGDAAAVNRLAEMASSAAARGASITGRLLTFARRGELAGVPIEPHALLEGLREMLTHILGAGITVQVVADTPLPCLQADRAQLETVLVNLTVNARDAMPDGGLVTLTAAAETITPNTQPDGELEPGQYVRISLRDTGVGMTPEILARACEPFFTTKEPGQGTGLGLAMARGFAKQSGGALRIESEPGAGTVVSLWFPQSTAEAEQAQATPAPSPEPPSLPMRLMLVDDDSMVREVMAGELEARGFVVTTACDGPAALNLLDTGQVMDLVITDYAMPKMDGLTLIRQMRQRRPNLPALLLTGYAEGTAEVSLSEAQNRLTVLLRKPIGGDELATRILAFRRTRG
jgi:signal transduction histidine kinase